MQTLTGMSYVMSDFRGKAAVIQGMRSRLLLTLSGSGLERFLRANGILDEVNDHSIAFSFYSNDLRVAQAME